MENLNEELQKEIKRAIRELIRVWSRNLRSKGYGKMDIPYKFKDKIEEAYVRDINNARFVIDNGMVGQGLLMDIEDKETGEKYELTTDKLKIYLKKEGERLYRILLARQKKVVVSFRSEDYEDYE